MMPVVPNLLLLIRLCGSVGKDVHLHKYAPMAADGFRCQVTQPGYSAGMLKQV